jgi:hypothetical protein
MIKNKRNPNRLGSMRIRADSCDFCACCDVFDLFAALGVSPEEYVVLWNMANEKIGCRDLRNILVFLQRNNNLK